MSTSMAHSFVTTVFLLLITCQQSLIHANHFGCAVDEQLNFYMTPEDESSQLLLKLTNLTSEDECYKHCCELQEQGVDCHGATFFPEDGELICMNLRCDPLSSCVWTIRPLGRIAWVKLYNTSESEDSNGEASGQNNAVGSEDSDSDSSGDDADESNAGEDWAQDEADFEAQVDKLFSHDNEDDQWNLNYDYDFSTTTFSDEENWENPSWTTTAWEEENTEDSDVDTSTEPPTGGHRVITKPHTAHGNTGMYGPKEIEDLDYSGVTPLIVIGAVMTVLFMLILLVCVGRKLTERERLQYRPLRESFPVNNAYHDIE